MQLSPEATEMSFDRIADWDDAYANSPHIPGADAYPGQWARRAADFRGASGGAIDVPYGPAPSEKLDLFWPQGRPKGLLVFLHGGYWMAFAKEDWSHLAAGALAQGWAVAMPSYPLCPDATLPVIVQSCARAVGLAAERVPGPVILSGHSAGGHLAARLCCADSLLAEDVRARLRRCAPISGLFDLRPLLRTAMRTPLHLDEAQARDQSPALQEPWPGLELLAIVGALERPEFRRQSALGAMAWAGLGARTRLMTLPGRHHFDVIDDLAAPGSALIEAMLA